MRCYLPRSFQLDSSLLVVTKHFAPPRMASACGLTLMKWVIGHLLRNTICTHGLGQDMIRGPPSDALQYTWTVLFLPRCRLSGGDNLSRGGLASKSWKQLDFECLAALSNEVLDKHGRLSY